jgi:hypothetical protein
MRNGTYYLNNSGHRWVHYESNGKKVKILILPDEYSPSNVQLLRTALYFEAFGNFVAAIYSYKGKKYKTVNYKLLWDHIHAK